MNIQEITPQQLAEQLCQNKPLFLLDVREQNEVEIAAISGSHHIVMNLVPIYINEIPDETDIVVYCHHGVRSLAVASYLIENGFDADRIYNLTGGIDAWALTEDLSMPRY